MGNRIPRSATLLDIDILIDTSANAKKMRVEKTERGWIGTDENGKSWFVPVAHLRNENYCKVKVIA